MDIKDILVFLDDGKASNSRLEAAITLAKRHGAILTGVALGSMKPLHAPDLDDEAIDRMAKKQAEQTINDFIHRIAQEDIEGKGLLIYGDARNSAEQMGHYARNHDLVILAQPNPSQSNYIWLQSFAEDVLLLSGRPVFFMPYFDHKKISFDKIMIAWDGTPAASRAVHDALPLLAHAEDVVVLIVESNKQKTFKSNVLVEGLLTHLLNHDTQARVLSIDPGDNDVSTVLLNQLSDGGMDMLVMGGYGTPTLKQKIFGGVSTTLLSSMIVPILMAH